MKMLKRNCILEKNIHKCLQWLVLRSKYSIVYRQNKGCNGQHTWPTDQELDDYGSLKPSSVDMKTAYQ